MLEVSTRQVVIVGGGAVSARKLRTLLEAGATRVRVIAPSFDEKLPAAQGVERVQKRYDSGDLSGAGLVYAATDSAAVNTQVVRDAQSRGVLVNRLDDADPAGGFV